MQKAKRVTKNRVILNSESIFYLKAFRTSLTFN